jgi:hypothetical protein
VSWRDRDYARWTPDERRRYLGSHTDASNPTATSSSSRFGAPQGAALAASVSLVLFGLGQLPRGHPIIPALHFNLPSSSTHSPASELSLSPFGSPARVTLRGPSVISVGSFLTFHGQVPTGDEGQVRILGSLAGRAWQTLAVADGSSDGISHASESTSAERSVSACSSAMARRQYKPFTFGRATGAEPAARFLEFERW